MEPDLWVILSKDVRGVGGTYGGDTRELDGVRVGCEVESKLTQCPSSKDVV